MTTVWRFLVKFASLIVCTLHCFDRVLFKGHLALAAPHELERFVDCTLKVRRSDFMKTMAPQYSDRLVEHAQEWARKEDRTYLYRTASWSLWRDHRVFVPYATIQNWVEDGGEKGGAANPDRLPQLGAVGLLGLHRRRRAL